MISTTKSVFDKCGPSRKSGEAGPDLREIEANSPLFNENLRTFCPLLPLSQ